LYDNSLQELTWLSRLDEIEQEASRATRLPLTDFKLRVRPSYRNAPHLTMLDEHLQQVSRFVETGGREGIGFLIVEMPPRHGKSLTVSRLYPAWHLGYNPKHRFMQVSYAADLAHKNSRFVRNLIRTVQYRQVFPRIELAADSQAMNSWEIAGHEGGMEALGIEGGATGKGAHILSIDDPIKSRKQAESLTYRNAIWDAFTDDLYTRLEPGGAVIMTMTRWHEDDMVGRAVLMEDVRIVRLRLPALAEANDPLGREKGQALWAVRYNEEKLSRLETTLGAYSFSALYQQNPVPAEGGIFKRAWLPKIDQLPPVKRSVRYWDLAMSERTQADYTVGARHGIDDNGHRYVMDISRFQKEWGDVVPEMKKVILADGKHVHQGIEMKGFMSRAVKMLVKDPDLAGFVIRGYDVDSDKVTRALPFAAKCGAGLYSVLKRHWTEAWVEEICSFPNGANDDQEDASAGADNMLDNARQYKDAEYTRTI
jgi:predicted phage terminase large subunit-like protein